MLLNTYSDFQPKLSSSSVQLSRALSSAWHDSHFFTLTSGNFFCIVDFVTNTEALWLHISYCMGSILTEREKYLIETTTKVGTECIECNSGE